jgi:hypothetical protein
MLREAVTKTKAELVLVPNMYQVCYSQGRDYRSQKRIDKTIHALIDVLPAGVAQLIGEYACNVWDYTPRMSWSIKI